VHALEGAVWGAVPLADLGTPTFVLRDSEASYVAQFRHKTGDQHAHIVFIAPDLERCSDDGPWLRLLDAMVFAAGRRGAFTLNAEISETNPAFTALRQCGFAVYARQEIWKRAPAPIPPDKSAVLRAETEADAFGIQSLYASVVPRLVLQADAAPEVGHEGFVYEQDERILAYLSVQEGKCGFYIRSFVHPESDDQAPAILKAALAHLPRAERIPVYFQVRRYQDWLRGSLSALGFESWTSQAVMVKHTACRIEQAEFKPVHALEGVVHAFPRSPSKLMGTEHAQRFPL
jgi:hypothetical protein